MSKFVPYGMLTFCKNCGEQNPYHRELTDKEIMEIYNDQANRDFQLRSDPFNFARAILKKASEK